MMCVLEVAICKREVGYCLGCLTSKAEWGADRVDACQVSVEAEFSISQLRKDVAVSVGLATVGVENDWAGWGVIDSANKTAALGGCLLLLLPLPIQTMFILLLQDESCSTEIAQGIQN